MLGFKEEGFFVSLLIEFLFWTVDGRRQALIAKHYSTVKSNTNQTQVLRLFCPLGVGGDRSYPISAMRRDRSYSIRGVKGFLGGVG